MKVSFVGNPHRTDFEQGQEAIASTIIIAVWDDRDGDDITQWMCRRVIGRDEYDLESASEDAETAVFRWRERKMHLVEDRP